MRLSPVSFLNYNPEYKRHPNYTKTDQLPISEVITGLPRPYYHSVHIYILRSIYINVFFWSIGIYFSSGRGSFLVLSAPWHAGSPPGYRAQVWALAEVRGICSGGSKWQVPTGSDSDHVEPARPTQTHVQVKKMSDSSCTS